MEQKGHFWQGFTSAHFPCWEKMRGKNTSEFKSTSNNFYPLMITLKLFGLEHSTQKLDSFYDDSKKQFFIVLNLLKYYKWFNFF